MTQPLDQRERLEALDPLNSICVSAPAGSGKTELLTQRVLRLLSRVDEPENILAITFTRKAASEMRARIIETLNLALEPCPDSEHKKLSWELANKALARDSERQWNLLDNPNRLQIQTIDSFCASLTRMMPVLSQFGSQPAITEDASALYEQACIALFDILDESSEASEALSTLLVHLDNDLAKLQRLLVSLLSKRDQWLSLIIEAGSSDAIRSIFENETKVIINQRLKNLYHKLTPYQSDLMLLADYSATHQDPNKPTIIASLKGRTDLPSPQVSLITQWQALRKLLLNDKGDWRKSVDKRLGFPTQTLEGDKQIAKARKDQLKELINTLQTIDNLNEELALINFLPKSEHFDDYQWKILKSLTALLSRLVVELLWIFKQKAEVDYTQITLGALTALGGQLAPTELSMRLNHQLKHILIDEFQDTSSSQFTLLSRLIEGWAEHNHLNPEQPNTLFLVGDGMQSIYAFRQANVGLFLEAKESGVNQLVLNDIALKTNFRSTKAIVNWINDSFAKSFPAAMDLSRGAVPYASSKAYNQTETDSNIHLRGFVDDDGSAQAHYVVEVIEQQQRNNPEQSIAVLVRSRNHLHDIVSELTRKRISWNANEIDRLNFYPVVKDLLTLLSAALNLHDDVAWTALLRTPWVGLDNKDLYYLSHSPEKVMWDKIQAAQSTPMMSNQAAARLEKLTTVMASARSHRQRLSTRLWIHSIWLGLGGAATLNSEADIAYAQSFFDLIDRYEHAGTLDLHVFSAALDKQYTSLIGTDSKLHLMTIHKSKGLEFDTVILPSLHKQTRSDDKALFLSREFIHDHGEKGLLMSPIAAKGSDDDSLYQFLDKEIKLASSFEDTRLLYVAATRAIRNLHILFSVTDKGEGELSKPPASSLIGKIWPAIEEAVIWQYPDKPETLPDQDHEQFDIDFDSHSVERSLNRLTVQWRPPNWQFNNPLDSHYLEESTSAQSSDSNTYHRGIGTVTHLILEQLVLKGREFWQEMAVDHRDQWLSGLLQHHQLIEDELRDGVNDVTLAINNTLADKYGRWLLKTHQFSTTEMSVIANRNQHVNERILDRVFLEDKTYWIADYKTSKPKPEESQQDFIARESSNYKQQLTEYSDLLREMLQIGEGYSIRKGLYFTYYPLWVEL